MLKRFISALIGLVLFFVVMFSQKAVLSASVVLLSVMSLFEVFNAYGYNKHKIFIVMGAFSSLIFSFGDFYKPVIVLSFFFVMLVFYIAIMLYKHGEITSKDVFTIVFLNLLIPFVFSAIGYIKRMQYGYIYVWLPFLSAWATDTLAYFSGRFFGKTKLCEAISPKKTVEGAIGGTIGSVVLMVIFAMLFSRFKGIDFNYPRLLLLAFSSSVLSQMGDLFASCIKRENKIKDFGNIMPGHGGVLDRFDSLILTVPYIFIFLKFLPII